jgi:alkylated DNA repair dioxygenase AlkB
VKGRRSLSHVLAVALFAALVLLVGLPVAAQAAVPMTPDPQTVATNGYISATAVAADGSLFIGGSFTTVGGVSRNNIAHILADGSLDLAWNAGADSTVRALAVSGNTVYAGGDFNTIGGQPRSRIAALDTTTGLAKVAWNPNADAHVFALAVNGSTVYAGGWFTTIGGQTRNCIAALDATTGLVTAWNPNATAGTAVWALAVNGSTVYAGGAFTSIGGQTRNRIAALDTSTGLATAWNPNANGSVDTLAVNGSTVYAGGEFATIGGQSRNGIAALDATTGSATAWSPGVSGEVTDLAVSGSTVYVAGYFVAMGGQPRNRLAALDAATGLATAWNPNPSGVVSALSASDGAVYVGGFFASIGGQMRQGFAAFRDKTLTLTPSVAGGASGHGTISPSSDQVVYLGATPTFTFTPNAGYCVKNVKVDGSVLNPTPGDTYTFAPLVADHSISVEYTATRPVASTTDPALVQTNGTISATALAADGSVYIGGTFTTVGGVARSNIAHILADGSLDLAWNPGASSTVSALAVSGNTVYAGGSFVTIGGQTRSRIAALDTTTGLALPAWNPNSSGAIWTLAVSGSNVYAGGSFTTIGGQTRNRIAALDVATGLATTWNPDANNNVDTLAVRGSTVYAGGAFTTIGGQTRRNIAALDVSTGLATAWNPTAYGGSVGTLAISGSTVYVGGGFDTIGGQARRGLAALDVTTGAATAWNPNPNSGAEALAVSGNTVYAGGNFVTIGGQARKYIAALDASTGLATAWNPNPNGSLNIVSASNGAVYVGGVFTSIDGQMRRGFAVFRAQAYAVTASVAGGASGHGAISPSGTQNVGEGSTPTFTFAPDAGYRINEVKVDGAVLNPTPTDSYTFPPVMAAHTISVEYVPLLPVSSIPNAATVQTNREVLAIAPAADGSVYIGGRFTEVGGVARNGVAHILADGSLDAGWDANMSNTGGDAAYVKALAVSGNTLYIGGHFSMVSGLTRGSIAAVNATTGQATAWNPGASMGTVNALAVSGGIVYVGGEFTSIAGQPRSYLAALNQYEGTLTAWNPNPDAKIDTLAVSGGIVYAGGFFNSIGGQSRRYLAALDTSTGLATDWNPSLSPNPWALAVSGNTVYAAGWLTTVGDQARKSIAAIDATTGLATAWDPKSDGMLMETVATSGNIVYAGGAFSSIGGQSRTCAAALDASTGLATSWYPRMGDQVHAIATSGDAVYVGGMFTTVGGQTRRYFAVFQPRFHAITPSVVGGASGHGTISPGSAQSVAEGTTPKFTFAPDAGYHVKEVKVDGSVVAMTGTNEYTFPAVSAAHTISVEFAVDTFAITPSVVGGASGHGTISPATAQTVEYGATPEFSFSPDTGYHVKTVKVDGDVVTMTGTNEYTFPAVSAAHSISVEFAVDTFAITPSVVGGAAGHGTISPAAAQTVEYGATPKFTFAPDAHYHVKTVKVDGSVVAMTGTNEYTFAAVTAAHTISVEFAVDTFTITPSVVGGASGHGTISPATAQTVDYGAHPTFRFTPDAGYRVKSVKVDGAAVSPTPADSYTFAPITADHTIAVEYVLAAPVRPTPDLGTVTTNGTVYAIAPAADGSVYIGGDFTMVGGVARNNIAHVLADGSLDASWNPNADYRVRSLAVSGDTVYAGGYFTSIGGQSRSYLAALDATTGLATSWDPHANALVGAIAVSGDTVYAGGDFTSIGGEPRRYLAAVDATTGLATPWDPNPDAYVRTLAVSGGIVYAGGDFTSIGGQSRRNLAALSATTGLATSWDPDADSMVFTLAVSGDTVYAGGDFTTVGGQPRNHIAALDAATGLATGWDPDADDSVLSLAVSGDAVYAAGGFFTIGGRPRSGIGALDATTGLATGWAPDANSYVWAVAVSDAAVYAGGDFTGIGHELRQGLAAFRSQTYAITPSVVGGVDGHGTISPAAAQTVGYGATPKFSFTPDTGYHVKTVRVDGDVVTMTGTNEYTFPAVSAAHTISVEFAVDTFSIKPSVIGTPAHGSISPAADQTVAYGTTPEFTFTPDTGYHVKTVKVDGDVVAMTGWNEYTFPAVSAAHTISVEFAVDTFSIKPSVIGGAAGHGTISPAADQTVDFGATPKFSFAPDAGYHVKEVKVDGSVVAMTGTNEYTFAAISAAHAISVEFAIDTFAITPSVVGGAAGHGTISPATAQTVEYGATPKFTFAPDAHYHVKEIRVDGDVVTPTGDNEYTFAAVDKAHSISVEFAPNTYTIKPSVVGGASGHGTISPAVDQAVGSGATPKFTFAPDAHYHVKEVRVDGDVVTMTGTNEYTFGVVTKDHTISVEFAVDTFSVTPSVVGGAAGHGTISPSSAQTVAYGATPKFSFAPDTGYHVKEVKVDGAVVSPTATNEYTFAAVTAAHAISVEFAIDTFTITPSVVGGASGHGAITPATEQTVDYGATPTFKFTPDAGYRVKSVKVDGDVLSPIPTDSYSFPAVTAGHMISVEFTTVVPLPPTPNPGTVVTNGSVYTIVYAADGSYYIGGDFTSVGGVPRNHIAHILADGTLDMAWNPDANGVVRTVMISGGVVYVGGDFTHVGGQDRNHLAALDAAAGRATGWNPDANGRVDSIVISGGGVVASGDFTTIGGQPRNHLAALDPVTGLATGWDPAPDGAIETLVVSGGVVYAGGDFTHIGGQPRNHIAALDAATGLATGWNPDANAAVRALVVSGAVVYAGGDFTHVGGQPRNHIAALDAATGLATGWNPDANAAVRTIVVSGGVVYAGGDFTAVGGQPRNHIASLDAATGLATGWNPDANGPVDTLTVTDGGICAGGDFTTIGGQPRQGLADFREQTYVITPSVVGAPAHGTISPATAQPASYGATPKFTFAPEAGYHVKEVKVDGAVVSPTPTDEYTFAAVAASHTISVEFAIDTFTIRPSVTGGHGTISPDAAQTVDYGATPAFTFTPDSGYGVDTVSVDGIPVTMTGEDAYTFPAVAADHAISVSFRAIVGPPPVTTVSGQVAGWSRRPVRLRFSAVPAAGGAPVAYTEYRVGNGPWARGATVKVAVQGETTVAYRSVDTIGDVEATRAVKVRIDTFRPRVVARPARGLAHAATRLRFCVRDRLPGSGYALVRLAVTDASGHILTRASVRPAAVDRWRTMRISGGRLDPGVYTVSMRAVDGAGNFQRGLTYTTLTVR